MTDSPTAASSRAFWWRPRRRRARATSGQIPFEDLIPLIPAQEGIQSHLLAIHDLGPRFRGDERMLLRQFDNLVHALYAVIDRDLNERMLFLDPQPRFFRSFVGRIRGFRLPIHLEVKSAAVRLLALRNPLRNGLLRRRGHSYGLGRRSRRRCHLMISFKSVQYRSAAAGDE